ncbi:MAG TPA: sugar ABC transporter permease [Ruminiclostridium sp.]|nr:sugar ABC transporter permease [Ruminiclostridium sp.]
MSRFGGKSSSLTNRVAPLVFITPALLLILLTCVVPFSYSVYLSFQKYNLMMPSSTIHFIGLDNYKTMLSNDMFRSSVGWTLMFTVVAVSVEIVLGMIMALILNNVLIESSSSIFKTLLLIPMMVGGALQATIWTIMYSPVFGIINNILQLLGFKAVNWTAQTGPARFAIIIVDVWQATAFIMLVFMAALKTVPTELYEAAYIDGARRGRVFFKITLPLIRNFIALVVSIRVMDALRMFEIPYMLTNGGPGVSTETIGTAIYKTAFRYFDIGAGSAGGILFFLLIATVIVASLKIMRKDTSEY